jgi:stage III sporulation protein AH
MYYQEEKEGDFSVRIFIVKRRIFFAIALLIFGGVLFSLGSENKAAVDKDFAEEAVGPGGVNEPLLAVNPAVQPLLTDILNVPGGEDINGKTGDEFFIEYRLERERLRSRQISLLREIVDNPNSLAENRSEAQRQLLDIIRRKEQELELENLILAKGYKEGVVFLQPMAATIVLRKYELDQTDIIRIADLVNRITGLNYEKITIVPKE